MRKKVSILGAGKVGSTSAQILAYREICDIVLWNRTAETAKGIALDIEESAPIEGFDVSITGTGDFSEIEGSDIVAITAGIPRKEGMSRDDLLLVNAGIVRAACQGIRKYAPDSKVIIVSNPLDAMCHVALKATMFPPRRVMGMAGILDSSRFRAFLAMELKVSVKDVSALVLGGHGDFMVPLPRYSSVEGIPVTEFLDKKRIAGIIERTRDAGAEILKLEKGSSAFYAPASSLVQMMEAILKDKRMVLPCASYLKGEYGIKGIFMGVPVVLGSRGIERVVELELTKEEAREVGQSSRKIRELVCRIEPEVC